MIVVLELGLYRLVSCRVRARAYWIGFEVGGWAYVALCMVFAGTAWGLARSLFERHITGSQISFPSGWGQFVPFACGIHLTISLVVAFVAGILVDAVWRRLGGLRAGKHDDESSDPGCRSRPIGVGVGLSNIFVTVANFLAAERMRIMLD
jgi:hypothetical protein